MIEELLGNNGAYLIALSIVTFLLGIVLILVGGIWKKIDWRSDPADTFWIVGWIAFVVGLLIATLYVGTTAVGYYLTQLLQ